MKPQGAFVGIPTKQDYLRCSNLSILNSVIPVKIIIVPVVTEERLL